MLSRLLFLLLSILAAVPHTEAWAAANYEESLKQLAEGVTAAAIKARKRKLALVEFTNDKGETTPVGQLLTDELATQLLVGGELKVVERKQVQKALAGHEVTTVDPAHTKAIGKVAKELDADLFVVGTYVDTPTGVQVTMKLIRPQKADVLRATRGLLPKTGQLGDLIKEANKPVAKVDTAPKKPDTPPGLGFHRNEQYELVVLAISRQGKLATVDLTVENRTRRDMKLLCSLQKTVMRDPQGTIWPQQVEGNREGLCTRGIELQPREKERTVLTFVAPTEELPAEVALQWHELSPRRDAAYTIEGLKAESAVPATAPH
jgi:TolB-like protein